jgi:hypothetical protein
MDDAEFKFCFAVAFRANVVTKGEQQAKCVRATIAIWFASGVEHASRALLTVRGMFGGFYFELYQGHEHNVSVYTPFPHNAFRPTHVRRNAITWECLTRDPLFRVFVRPFFRYCIQLPMASNIVGVAADLLCQVMTFLDPQSHCRCLTLCKTMRTQGQRRQSYCGNLTISRTWNTEAAVALLRFVGARVTALDISLLSAESTDRIIRGVMAAQTQQAPSLSEEWKEARTASLMPVVSSNLVSLSNLVVNWHPSVGPMLSQQQQLRVLQLSLNEWSKEILLHLCALPALERLLLRFGSKCAALGKI